MARPTGPSPRTLAEAPPVAGRPAGEATHPLLAAEAAVVVVAAAVVAGEATRPLLAAAAAVDPVSSGAIEVAPDTLDPAWAGP